MRTRRVDGVAGRQGEQAALAELVAGAAQGRGAGLLIEGEPGIGKTAVLALGLAQAGAAGFRVLHGSCADAGKRRPLAAMRRLLGAAARTGGGPTAGTRDGAPAEAAPDWPLRALAADPVAAASERMLAAVARMCAAGPVLLALEDLQWADEESVLMLRRLCRGAPRQPLLVVGTCGPLPRQPEVDRLRRDLRRRSGGLLTLEPLPGAAVAELVRLLTGSAPGPLLAARLESAAGNPRYVRELLQALRRQGALRGEDGTLELAAADAPGRLPSELGRLAQQRLDALDPVTRELLRAAALLGPEFSVADVAAVLGRGPGGLLGAVEEALAAGVVQSAGTRLRFRHDLVQQALREAAPPAERRNAVLALTAARAPAERVAELILAAPGAEDDWVADWLVQHAGELAERSTAVAARLLEDTVRRTGSQDPRGAALAGHLAALHFRTGRAARAEETARAALEHTGDPEVRGRARWVLVASALRRGGYQDAVREWRTGAADPRLGAVWQPRLQALAAVALACLGRQAQARQAAEHALAEGRRLGDRSAVGHALHAASVLRARDGDPAAALLLIDGALTEIGTAPDLVDLRLSLLGNRAACLDGADRLREAQETLALARHLAERVGTTRLSMTLVQCAEHYYEHGRWDDALAALHQVTGLPQPHWRLAHRGLMALVCARRGRWSEAREHLDALGPQEATPGWPTGACYVLAARALAAERSGRPAEAVRALAVLLGPEHVHSVRCHPFLLPLLVRSALAAGDEPTARAAAAAADGARSAATLRARAAADWCDGLLRRDPERLRAVAEYQRAAGRSPDLGRVLEDLAVLHAAAGEPAPARQRLAEALAVHAGLGADGDAARAGKLLEAVGTGSGGGTRQRPRSGWEALTATERRVAGLVAQGSSNLEISARLRLSRRTVETHVSHILAKLGVGSRREVGAAARAAAIEDTSARVHGGPRGGTAADPARNGPGGAVAAC